jgi:hypothetical protein
MDTFRHLQRLSAKVFRKFRVYVPVCIVGPNVVESTYRNPATRKILCDVSKREVSKAVANFGAELAAENNAGLILQQVIPPQELAAVLRDVTIHQIEAELPTLVPANLQRKVSVQTRVTLGDPTEELLYQGRAQQANLIVLGLKARPTLPPSPAPALCTRCLPSRTAR